jgi:tetratricopeptide (TPR) repeat protein
MRHKGNRDGAIADYTKAIELNPGFADAYVGRGIVYQVAGDRDRAIADYTKAVELNPDYSSAYLNRGNIFAAMGDQDRAIADYNKVIEINPAGCCSVRSSRCGLPPQRQQRQRYCGFR